MNVSSYHPHVVNNALFDLWQHISPVAFFQLHIYRIGFDEKGEGAQWLLETSWVKIYVVYFIVSILLKYPNPVKCDARKWDGT